MDPLASLSANAVAVLAPYLAKASEEFAKEASKAAISRIGNLYHALKTQFKNKPAAKSVGGFARRAEYRAFTGNHWLPVALVTGYKQYQKH